MVVTCRVTIPRYCGSSTATRYKGISRRTKEFLDRTGTFSLYIKNVSEKDVGNYTCLAKVSAGGSKTDDDEDYVELPLHKNAELLL